MIGSLGLPEILFVLVLALLVFGPKRLPQMGRTLGKALGEFRRATNDLKRTVDNELRADLISGDDLKLETASGTEAKSEATAPAEKEDGAAPDSGSAPQAEAEAAPEAKDE